jgi:hypothetical protein
MFAAKHIAITVTVTIIAAIKEKPSRLSGEIVAISYAA